MYLILYLFLLVLLHFVSVAYCNMAVSSWLKHFFHEGDSWDSKKNNLHKSWKTEISWVIWDNSQAYTISDLCRFLEAVQGAAGRQFSWVAVPVSHSCSCIWLLYYIPGSNSTNLLNPSSLMLVGLFLWSVITDQFGLKRY